MGEKGGGAVIKNIKDSVISKTCDFEGGRLQNHGKNGRVLSFDI